MAHPKHDEVRQRYDACCGYCGVSDETVGGELTVDHFVPVALGGDESDENLVYACFRCNLFKADFHPTESDQRNGHVLLHPRRDDLAVHVRFDMTSGELIPLTETGRFHIVLLHLNRPALIAYRLRNRYQELLRARNELLEAEIAELQAIIGAQERYISHLKHLVDNDGDHNQP